MPTDRVGFRMRPFCPETDLEIFLHLFKVVFDFEGTPEMWRWKYLPPWTDRLQAWVVLDEDRVVGFAGGTPLRGWHNGRDIPFLQIGDVMVHPEFRAKQDYIRTATLCFTDEVHEQEPHCVIYGFTTHRAFLWYQRIGLINLIERAVEIAVVPGRKDLPTGGTVRREYELEKWGWDAPEADRLWEEHKDSMTLGLVRDGAYLRWRYAAHPGWSYELYGVSRKGRAVGWLVVRGTLARQDGRLPAVHVVDLLVPDASHEAILAAAADQMPVERLRFWLPQRLSSRFAGTRPTRINVLHLGQQARLSPEYLREHLYYTEGDADWN